LELGVAAGNGRALLVLGDEPEAGFAREGRVERVGTERRVDPPTTGHEPGVRIVEDDEDAVR